MSINTGRRGFLKGAGVFTAVSCGGLGISRPAKDVVGGVVPNAECGDGAKSWLMKRGVFLG